MLAALQVVLGMLLAGAECPDLSGRFRLNGEDGYVAISVVQSTCEALSIEWNMYSHPDTVRGKHEVRADGTPRRVRQWFGGSDSMFVIAEWRGQHLEIRARKYADNTAPLVWQLALGL